MAAAPASAPSSLSDAVRLADQASFGPNESLVAEIRTVGPLAWVASQMALPPTSRYTSGLGGELHQQSWIGEFCASTGNSNCYRDYYSAEPLLWDFYRNAVSQPDQLRQRVAYALQQIVVVSALEVNGTYGFRNYQNNLLDLAFGNYRDVLKKVALSPVMGDFLNNANNDKAAPNENFARELLQLFSLGTCLLNPDGSLQGGQCLPVYGNETVRAYAFALTGWTYPLGGATPVGCYPLGSNCRYYGGDMVPVEKYHDVAERSLLSNVVVPKGQKATGALEQVLDSLMAHPNMAPFIGRQLIQSLVSSNPSPAYVQRVAAAFSSGSFQGFGAGRAGDLAATVAAVLLDPEARGEAGLGRNSGRLREPALMFTGVLRALNGQTDGNALGWWWGERLRHHLFRAPSVFNFYRPDHPVPGTGLVGPAFGIHETNTALERLNFLTYAVDWSGGAPDAGVPNATGTQTRVDAFVGDADDPARLVDRLSELVLGRTLQGASRKPLIDAVAWWTAERDSAHWRELRVRTAAYLLFASPQYQVQR